MPIPPENETAQAFYRAILDQPEEDTPRLAYADCLEEIGNEEMECEECAGSGKTREFREMPPWGVFRRTKHYVKCKACQGSGHVPDRTNTAHASLIREMVTRCDWYGFGEGAAASVGVWIPDRRADSTRIDVPLAPALPGVAYVVRRGFVDELRLDLRRFEELFGPRIVGYDHNRGIYTEAKHEEMRRKFPYPLTRITLADRAAGHADAIPESAWRWWKMSRALQLEVPADISDWLFDRLSGEAIETQFGCCKEYPTSETALSALSSACIRHFRPVCGIGNPPQETTHASRT